MGAADPVDTVADSPDHDQPETRSDTMTTRDSAPTGAPCWVDLFTSDVEGSRRFYGELFGWEAGEPSPEFGGYFMFNRNGVPTAGCMGAMDGVTARDLWTIYLATDDITGTLKAAEAE